MPKIVGIDHSGSPIGTILPIAYDTSLPAGTLLCDGSAINRTTFAHLFTAIGTAWGTGDGSTTFNLPDLRGKFIRGRDHATGNDPDASGRLANASGGATGDLVGSVQADDFKSHLHTIPEGLAAGAAQSLVQSGTAAGIINSNATGGNETRPKNAYSNYVIAYI